MIFSISDWDLFSGPEWCDNDESSEIGPDANGGAGAGAGAGGDDDSSGNEKKPKTAAQTASEVMIAQMVEATDGVMCDVEVAMANLQNRERRAKKPMGWKVSLEIGNGIRINTVGYIQVRSYVVFRKFKMSSLCYDSGSERGSEVLETMFGQCQG